MTATVRAVRKLWTLGGHGHKFCAAIQFAEFHGLIEPEIATSLEENINVCPVWLGI